MHTQKSLVRIVVESANNVYVGTGFFIRPNVVLTCAHVLLRNEDLSSYVHNANWQGYLDAQFATYNDSVRLYQDTSELSFEKIHCIWEYDIAIITCKHSSKRIVDIEYAKPDLGTEVYTLGYPFTIETDLCAYPLTYNKGYIATYTENTIGTAVKKPKAQISMYGMAGASGSPIFTKDDKCIGILNGLMQWGGAGFVMTDSTLNEMYADTFNVPLPITYCTLLHDIQNYIHNV